MCPEGQLSQQNGHVRCVRWPDCNNRFCSGCRKVPDFGGLLTAILADTQERQAGTAVHLLYGCRSRKYIR